MNYTFNQYPGGQIPYTRPSNDTLKNNAVNLQEGFVGYQFQGQTPQTEPRGGPRTSYNPDIQPGYSDGTGSGSAPNAGNPLNPDANGYYWTLTNGLMIPPVNTMLIANGDDIKYYEDKEFSTRFQVIGRTMQECTRDDKAELGVYTGQYVFLPNKKLGALQVRTKFPFNRLNEPVETEYILWVATMDLTYNNTEPTGNTAPVGNGYGTIEPTKIGSTTTKNNNLIWLLVAGVGIVLLSSKK